MAPPRIIRSAPGWLALVAAQLLACGSTVEVGAGAGAAAASDGAGAADACIPCSTGFFTPWDKGVPNFCPEERKKWDALIACACTPETCAKDLTECRTDPGGEGPPGSGEICDNGDLDGICGRCLMEHCREEAEACGAVFE